MSGKVAKVAVSAATYWIDKPYDYLIPEEYEEIACPGMRVMVPFSSGNRRSEGVILAVADKSDYPNLKPIQSFPDDKPVLTENQLHLAYFMRERFFCTVFDALKAMLPVGMWFDSEGNRRVKDKTVEMVRLAIAAEDAAVIADNKKHRSPQQKNLIELLCSFGALPSREMLSFTGAGRQSLKALVKQGIIELYQREAYRRPELYSDETVPLPVLNSVQQKAFEGLKELSCSGKAGAALLFGVTGSGKTSVYIHLISTQLERGCGAILLVPEISLTPQMISVFSSHFGNRIAVLHSSLSSGERYDEWKRIKSGEAKLVIGTRSAVFAPVDRLGLIIIDEEQEESYKSENSPRYNARDVAKFLCAQAGCLLVLGSATPDICSMYYAKNGRYAYFELPERYNDMQLPKVSIVDMKRELRHGNNSELSLLLKDEIQKNIDCGEQSIVFINRRGTAKLISCQDCGYTYRCRNCSANLTYHSAKKRLICHYCGYSQWLDEACPSCGGTLRFTGAGTQAVEEELHELFPDAAVLRMDTDTVAPAGSHEELFDRFRRENIPIMVGTQMVTKGLNFENVTLVGVISADQALYTGDFRASERAFSIITQVIGRSGRGSKPGRAVIQTYTPDNETINQAAQQNYPDFYKSEISMRSLQNSPPFSELLSVTCSGQNEELVVRCTRYIKKYLDSVNAGTDMKIMGPVALPIVKVNNRYRYRVNICCENAGKLRNHISYIVSECSTDKRFRGVSVYADNDPTY